MFTSAIGIFTGFLLMITIMSSVAAMLAVFGCAFVVSTFKAAKAVKRRFSKTQMTGARP